MPVKEYDKKFIQLSRVSPRYFILKIWGLVAQPVKPEFADFIKTHGSDEWKNSMFEEFISGKHYTWQQNLIFEAVEKAIQNKGKRRIGIKSGHGTGKSASVAILILWFLFCWKDAQVPCTAPTGEQMHDVLWKELSIWLGKMPEEIKGLYEWQTGYIRMKERPEKWFARARTARKENPEALAGMHGEHVMFVIDEGSAVPEEIFNTAEGALTGPNILVIMPSNPTRIVGYFYDVFHDDKENWQTIELNSEESPIVDKSYIERITNKHGKGSDEYKIRIAGKFPAEEGKDDKGYTPLFVRGDYKLISAEDNRFVGRKRMGIDPSGEGRNFTSFCVRDQFQAKIVLKEQISKPKQIAQRTLQLCLDYDIDFYDVWVDNFGEGANVAQEIALQGSNESVQARVNAINVGDDAEDKEHYLNIRAEASWRMLQWFKAGGEMVELKDIEKQILSLRKRRMTGKGSRMQMMSKLLMSKAGYTSPDDMDALMLTFVEEDNFGSPKARVKKPYTPSTIYGG